MECSINGIADSIVSEDSGKTKSNVRDIRNASIIEKAEITARPMNILNAVLNLSKPTLNGKKVDILDVKRSDSGEFTLKYTVGNNKEIITDTVDDFSSFETPSPTFNINKKSVGRLYSDADVIHNSDDFEKLALDITNNPEKIMEVANFLIDADEYHNDESHNRALFSQLGRITNALKELAPNMAIHINNAGTGNYGGLDLKTNSMYISKGIGGSKSLMEIYVHELYHAVTHYAIDSKDIAIRKYTARMQQIRDNFLANTTEKDLIKASGNLLTEEQAADILDHMSDAKVGLHEFVALSMTNKAVMQVLNVLFTDGKKENKEQSLFYDLLDSVYGLFNYIKRKILKEPNSSDLGKMVFLTAQLY